MSDRFILFNDEQIDAQQIMMLTDLAKLLLEDPNVKFFFQKFQHYDPINNTCNVSFTWLHRPEHYKCRTKNRHYVRYFRI